MGASTREAGKARKADEIPRPRGAGGIPPGSGGGRFPE